MTKSAVFYGLGHIYQRNPQRKISFFCAMDIALFQFTSPTCQIHFCLINCSVQASHDLDMPYKARQDISLEKEKDLSNHPMRIYTTQKMKFSINDFFSKCDQMCWKLRIWSHLLRKSLIENFIFCAVIIRAFIYLLRTNNSSVHNGES